MELDEQEAAFVKAFIVQDKQERYLRLLASPKRRRDILDRFNHNLDFKPEYAELIPQELRTADKVAGLLRAAKQRRIIIYGSKLPIWRQ